MPADELVTRYGEPEAVYAPSRGQTFAGVLVATAAAAVCFTIALFGCGFDLTNRVSALVLGVGAVVLAVWLWRLRRWRFVILANGVVQVRAWGVDEFAWADVRELVETRVKGHGDRVARVTLHGHAGTMMVVNPVNLRSRARLLRTLLEAAGRRGVPVRTEWVEPD